MKINVGILSCNKYCNFTNYGSALQTFALQTVINRVASRAYNAVIIDYCPDTMLDKDILNPFKYMWDKDEDARKKCEMTLPAIRINNEKFNTFYKEVLNFSADHYTSVNLNQSVEKENITGYVIGSDTVFCLEEFQLDKGYFADMPNLSGRSISYAASFGDSHFTIESLTALNHKLHNFKALGIRENQMIPYVKSVVDVPVFRTIDPTLLLKAEDYLSLVKDPDVDQKYVLIYARRYNPEMEAYARKIAKENGYAVVEISLQATNSSKGHIMRYDAGVEEFLGLIKNAECVFTNSFHGMIFAAQFRRPFFAFSRAECDTKIEELLSLFGLEHRLIRLELPVDIERIDYDDVHMRIAHARKESITFLEEQLAML